MFNVLVVDDDKNIRKLLSAVLKANGYSAYLASNGAEALQILDHKYIDLMIADIMMPQMNGFDLTRELRESGSTIPIIMLTAKQLQQDKNEGFLLGADDYLTKPFDEQELLLRMKALLRRAKVASEHKMTIGKVIIDYDARTVSREDETHSLPPKEFCLLFKLLSYPGKTFTRIQLLDEIWGMDSDGTDNTVNVHIARLRSKFESYPEFEILTVRGLGYRAVRKDDTQD